MFTDSLGQLLTWSGFVPIAADKSHGRIIWDCAWAAEGDIFATASRDKTVSSRKIQKVIAALSIYSQVKVWSRGDSSTWKAAATIKTNVSATAVEFAPSNAFSRCVILSQSSGFA